MTTRELGGKAAALVRSLLVVGVLLVAVPWALVAVATGRFGGGSPMHGVPPPSEWSLAAIRDALTDRVSDGTLADIVIRLGLVVGWVAVVVLVLTIGTETLHMVRHGGLPMPHVRGLGLAQHAARVVAAGLLVVVPTMSRPAFGSGLSLSRDAGSPATVVAGEPAGPAPARPSMARDVLPAEAPVPTAGGTYIVVPGDSVYGIAERFAGPDQAEVVTYADELLDLNLGREMVDGRRFTNAAFIDVGWELRLPGGERAQVDAQAPGATGVHMVERGDSLWSIADDRLGDPRRWPEVFDANAGRTFDDGRTLADPDLIHPGWNLLLPGQGGAVPAAPEVEVGQPPEHEPPDVPVVSDAVDRSGPPGAPTARPVPENGWHAPSWVPEQSDPAVPAADDEAAAAVPGPAPRGDLPASPAEHAGEAAPELLTVTRAAMLSAGVLTLLAVRRRSQLRRARPRAVLPAPVPTHSVTERALRSIDAGERFARVDVAVRAAALDVIDHEQRLLAALVAPDGEVELVATGRVVLPPPWEGHGDRWRLGASTPLELLAGEARKVGAPTPALVQLGQSPDGRDVYVDLEALGALEVGGASDQADAIVAAVAATLAGSVLAEVTTLIGVGVPVEAFLGHRLHVPLGDVGAALEVAASAVGSTASQGATTFELRARVTGGESWDPAIVLIGSGAGAVPLPSLRKGVAVVSAAPIHGPSSRLAPDGDAWALLPAGIRLVPIGLDLLALSAIASLVDVAAVEPEPASAELALVGDDTVVPPDEPERSGDDAASAAREPPWTVLVRLLGAVQVESASGERVEFERSKTRELIAWLATHRERPTRTGARTALWELDVRDATFANVVSEARRAMARLVQPPDGEEWVARTMTDALPLHPLVLTDADLLADALERARLQPPALAIATLTPAVERITGMPFEGTSYLWPDAEGITSSLVLLATSAAAELGAHHLSVGDVQGVFDATGHGLRVLAGHEELIGLRMRAHATTGDHAGVRQEWESYERVITADPWSDGEPSPKLVELRRELLSTLR